MRAFLAFGFVAVLLGCAPVEQHARSSAPVDEELIVSYGDQMIRVDRRESLPNLFGRADMFGRTRARGFIEIRYFGLDFMGNPIFRRRDIELVSTQTTMSETGAISVRSERRRGGSHTATAIGVQPPRAMIGVLPPDTIEFTLNLREGNVLTVEGREIEILQVTSSLVKFRIYDRSAARQPAASPEREAGSGALGTAPQDRSLPQNQPRDWNGMPMVRPPP